jgi:predicted DNA-binding protein (MmcQ/YjbR family)
MNIEELRDYCIRKPGVGESFPFDKTTLVFKVMGKMFLLTDTHSDFSLNIKFDPEDAIAAREHYPAVIPGYHMNKVHWNTVNVDGSISDEIIYQWIDNSYDLVVAKLTKKLKEELNGLERN